MKCRICNKTEEELISINSAQISQIDNIITMINEKLAPLKEDLNKIAASERKKHLRDYSGICECINNAYCEECTRSEEVDGKGNFWCNTYRKSFNILSAKPRINEELIKEESLIKEITDLEKDIEILNLRKNVLKNIKLKDIELFERDYDCNYEIFIEKIKKYNEAELLNENSRFKICPYCESMIEKILKDTPIMRRYRNYEFYLGLAINQE